MAKIVYMNAVTGNDANSGLSAGAAKKTFTGARAATAAATASTSASPDVVLMAPGVYYGTQGNGVPVAMTFSATTDTNVVYASDGTGEVLVDFENSVDQQQDTFASNFRVLVVVVFVGITFRNGIRGLNPGMSSHAWLAAWSGAFSGILPRVINCVFQQRDGTANQGRALFNVWAENCSFYNLERGLTIDHSVVTGMTNSEAYGNYFKTVTTPFTVTSGTLLRDYNAFSGNTETNGINTASANSDPGFRSVATDDLRLDPTTDAVAWDKFMTLGRYGGRIGATGKGGIYYDHRFPQLRMITATPSGAFLAWENDSSYTSGGVLGTIIQDATTNELKIDLVTTPTATDARARSDVYDIGSSSPNLATSSVFKFDDPSLGSAIDTNTTFPRRWAYRSSGTSFLKGDGTPTWTEVEAGTYINVSDRYVQFRITFRTDHTNA